MSTGTSAAERQLVVFNLAGQEYGVEIKHVNKIIEMEEVTEIPQTLDFVEGVINLRGDVIPIINLGRRFNLPGIEKAQESRIIIVEVGGMLVGMLVDAVSEVLSVPAEKIAPAPQVSGGMDANFLQGIALLEERLIILLDMNKILYEEEKSVLEKIG